MKILFITSMYVPDTSSGPSNAIRNYCTELVKRGHDVTIYTTDRFSKNKRVGTFRAEVDNVAVYYFRNLSNILAWRFKRLTPLKLRGYLRNNISKFDVTVIAETRSTLALLGYYYCRKFNMPYVFTAFGSLPRRNEGVKTLYDLFFVNPMIRNAKALLAQTEHEKHVYRQFGASDDQIVLLPLPVDNSSFKNLRPGQFRSKYNIPEDRKILLFVGRFNKHKGIEYLLELFGRCLDKMKNLTLVIAGRDDGYLDEINSLIRELNLSDNLILIDDGLYGDEKSDAYADADIFLITSCIFEETSMASLEACACGTAVAMTEQVWIPYALNYNAGIKLTLDLIEDTDSLLKVLATDHSLAEMGLNARRMIKEQHDVPVVGKQLEQTIRNATAKGE